MLKHSATKNTAFTRAPNTSARAHPNVFFDHFFGDICETNNSKITIEIDHKHLTSFPLQCK